MVGHRRSASRRRLRCLAIGTIRRRNLPFGSGVEPLSIAFFERQLQRCRTLCRRSDRPQSACTLLVARPPADPGYFPIAVWLQDPRNAEAYKRAGINLYVGLWQGPTEAQLAALEEGRHAGHLPSEPRWPGASRRPDDRRLDARRRARQRPGGSRSQNRPARLRAADSAGADRRGLRAPPGRRRNAPGDAQPRPGRRQR